MKIAIALLTILLAPSTAATSSKEQWLFSSKASFGFNPFGGILVDNDLWQCAALSNLDLTEF